MLSYQIKWKYLLALLSRELSCVKWLPILTIISDIKIWKCIFEICNSHKEHIFLFVFIETILPTTIELIPSYPIFVIENSTVCFTSNCRSQFYKFFLRFSFFVFKFKSIKDCVSLTSNQSLIIINTWCSQNKMIANLFL